MTSGSVATLALTDALPASTALLVLGLSEVSVPFKGGTLVPSPDLIIPNLPVDGAGTLTIPIPLPDPLPGGAHRYFQLFVVDGGAPHGLSASNGIVCTTI